MDPFGQADRVRFLAASADGPMLEAGGAAPFVDAARGAPGGGRNRDGTPAGGRLPALVGGSS